MKKASNKLQILKVDKGLALSLDLSLKPKIDNALRKKIERHWHSLCEANDKLFDGDVFVLRQMSRHAIIGCMVPYSWYQSALIDEEVRRELCLVTLGLSAVTSTPSHRVLLGRRSQQVSLFKSCYEFAPAGILDGRFVNDDGSIDFHGAILDELYEETHINSEEVLNTELFGVLFDPELRSVELCVAIFVTDKGFSDGAAASEEYPEILTLPADAIDEFLHLRSDELVPTSVPLWRAWHKQFYPHIDSWLP